MTKTTSTVGTPLYMSPEQLKSSKNVDVRTDLWAHGVILFELVSGRPPFRAESIAELGAKVLTTDAPDLRSLVPDAPEAFALAVRKCSAPAPGRAMTHAARPRLLPRSAAADFSESDTSDGRSPAS
jgi:serine/threonine-protein kinase